MTEAQESLHNADRRRAMAELVMTCPLPFLRMLECVAGVYSDREAR